MKSALRTLVLTLAACAFFSAPSGHAQSTSIGPRSAFNFAPVAALGQLNPVLDFHQDAVPSTYTIDWTVTGTTPTACTFYPEGSTDGVNWYALASSSTSSQVPLSCTASTMFHITEKPVVLFRIHIVAYTPGDGTTRVTFNYTRGSK